MPTQHPATALPPGTRTPRAAAVSDGRWEEWIAASLAGDARAYDRLLREVLPLLRGIARRRIADRAEAEDAVQDTLLTIHRLRHAYDPGRPLRPWLVALCERRCVDRLRVRGRLAARQVPIDAVEELPDREGAEAAAERAVAHAELREAVAALPRAQRLALTLAKLQDLPLAEASAACGLTVSALKVATHRAVRALRARLAGPEGAAAAAGR